MPIKQLANPQTPTDTTLFRHPFDELSRYNPIGYSRHLDLENKNSGDRLEKF